MTILEINKEITQLREERDRILNQANNLTACITALAQKREDLRFSLEHGDLATAMFGGTWE